MAGAQTDNGWLDVLYRCGGWYSGELLVAYRGTYDATDETKKRWVGHAYANFAKIEERGPELRRVSDALLSRLAQLDVGKRNRLRFLKSTGFCGAPEGGKALAVALAIRSQFDKRYIFPEKKGDELAFARHEPERGQIWWITEDICNNFSTTAKLVALVEKYGAGVAGVICYLNRSLDVDSEFKLLDGRILPVISLVREPIPEYRQEEPGIAMAIERGNIVWDPKKEWGRLMDAMRREMPVEDIRGR